ncbi:hypothetical protein AAG906_032137 [Vitis piasezkii]
MRKFDPWPVFFRREWNRNWPFLVGFAVTGIIITCCFSLFTFIVLYCTSPLNLFEIYEENYQRSQVNFCKPMEYLQIHALFGRKGKTCFCFHGV